MSFSAKLNASGRAMPTAGIIPNVMGRLVATPGWAALSEAEAFGAEAGPTLSGRGAPNFSLLDADRQLTYLRCIGRRG